MASLNFTDIADVGSKDRDSGWFLVQVSGVGVTQIDVHIEQRPPRGTRTCRTFDLQFTYGYRLLRQPVSVVLPPNRPGPAPCTVAACLPHHSSPRRSPRPSPVWRRHS